MGGHHAMLDHLRRRLHTHPHPRLRLTRPSLRRGLHRARGHDQDRELRPDRLPFALSHRQDLDGFLPAGARAGRRRGDLLRLAAYRGCLSAVAAV